MPLSWSNFADEPGRRQFSGRILDDRFEWCAQHRPLRRFHRIDAGWSAESNDIERLGILDGDGESVGFERGVRSVSSSEGPVAASLSSSSSLSSPSWAVAWAGAVSVRAAIDQLAARRLRGPVAKKKRILRSSLLPDDESAVIALDAQDVGGNVVQAVIDIHEIVIVDDRRRVVLDIGLFSGCGPRAACDEADNQ
jgi:hypothetical protein